MSRRFWLGCLLGVAFSSFAPGGGTAALAQDAKPDPARPASFDQRPESVPVSNLLGATVMSSGHEILGVVNDLILDRNGHAGTAVIGLAGYLGLGEKDVAIPFGDLALTTPFPAGSIRVFPNGHYAGSSPERVIVPLTIEQVAAAPAFVAKSRKSSVGVPSQSGGTPEGTTKEPKSSTESGGPG